MRVTNKKAEMNKTTKIDDDSQRNCRFMSNSHEEAIELPIIVGVLLYFFLQVKSVF